MLLKGWFSVLLSCIFQLGQRWGNVAKKRIATVQEACKQTGNVVNAIQPPVQSIKIRKCFYIKGSDITGKRGELKKATQTVQTRI